MDPNKIALSTVIFIFKVRENLLILTIVSNPIVILSIFEHIRHKVV